MTPRCLLLFHSFWCTCLNSGSFYSNFRRLSYQLAPATSLAYMSFDTGWCPTATCFCCGCGGSSHSMMKGIQQGKSESRNRLCKTPQSSKVQQASSKGNVKHGNTHSKNPQSSKVQQASSKGNGKLKSRFYDMFLLVSVRFWLCRFCIWLQRGEQNHCRKRDTETDGNRHGNRHGNRSWKPPVQKAAIQQGPGRIQQGFQQGQ